MRLKAALKDWRRRRALRRAGIVVEVERPQFAAGARSGVWVVDPTALGPDSVVYSFGVGDNVAWDLAMIEHFGCTVHAFDPTPRAAAWLSTQRLPVAFRHHALALAAHDGELAFLAPRKPRDVNFAPLQPGDARAAFRAPAARLLTIAQQLGHDRVDVLKLDIEGGEYDVLPDLLAHAPRVLQLLVEFHHGSSDRGDVPLQRTVDAVAALRAAGFRAFHVSRRGLELSFVRAPAG
jgi:FkbM family methyltransferase